jgi:hypothetical protein
MDKPAEFKPQPNEPMTMLNVGNTLWSGSFGCGYAGL